MHCTRMFSSPEIHISSFLDKNKTSDHVFFNLNLETAMWKHLLELEWSAGDEFKFY